MRKTKFTALEMNIAEQLYRDKFYLHPTYYRILQTRDLLYCIINTRENVLQLPHTEDWADLPISGYGRVILKAIRNNAQLRLLLTDRVRSQLFIVT